MAANGSRTRGTVIDATTAGAPVADPGQGQGRQEPGVKRAYHSETRREQARRTQARVHATAARLFASSGYARTSIRQIAEAAGVSVETIYAGGGKRTLFLDAFRHTLRGDTGGTPLLQLAALRPAAEAADLDTFLNAVIGFVVDANALGSRLWVAFVEAASSDAVLAEAYAEQMADMRLQGRRVLDHAVERGLCDEPRDPGRATDAIWAALHPSQYDLLVNQAGWSPAQFRSWATAAVRHILATL